MTDPLPRIALDTLVELLDRYSNVYPLSPTGARGWVRARREFPKSDPEIYVEWDKTHWRYHGEKDGWTFEHHFRPVQDTLVPEAADDPSTHEIPDMEKILAEVHAGGVPNRCPDCGGPHTPLPESAEEFLNALLQAQEAAVDSDGFFIITLRPRRDGEMVIYEPEIFCDALTETAREMIEAQVIHVATQLFDRHMLDRINQLGKQPGEPGY